MRETENAANTSYAPTPFRDDRRVTGEVEAPLVERLRQEPIVLQQQQMAGRGRFG